MLTTCKKCNGNGLGNFLGSSMQREKCTMCNGVGKIEYKRPSWNDYFIKILEGLKTRGTCPRRQCSALIIDERHILLSTGYNGTPSGIDNCFETPCGGQDDETGDTRNCAALHAEENAVLHLEGNTRNAHTMYCTNLPCFHCAKIICQTSIKTVIYQEDYADKRGLQLLEKKGIFVVHYKK